MHRVLTSCGVPVRLPTSATTQLFPILISTEKFIRKTCTNLAEIHNHCYPHSFTGPPHDVTISSDRQHLFFRQQAGKGPIITFLLLYLMEQGKLKEPYECVKQ